MLVFMKKAEVLKFVLGRVASFLFFYGIAGLFLIHHEIGGIKAVTDFGWQIIQLSLVLAALSWASNAAFLGKNQEELMSYCGLLFLFCAVVMLLSCGFFGLAVALKQINLAVVGGVIGGSGVICLSVSIAFMTVEMFDLLFQRIRSSKRSKKHARR